MKLCKSIDKFGGFSYSKVRSDINENYKGRERKSKKWECNREKMSPAENIFDRKISEVHSGADPVR